MHMRCGPGAFMCKLLSLELNSCVYTVDSSTVRRRNTWEHTWETCKRVDRDNFGLCLDTFRICGTYISLSPSSHFHYNRSFSSLFLINEEHSLCLHRPFKPTQHSLQCQPKSPRVAQQPHTHHAPAQNLLLPNLRWLPLCLCLYPPQAGRARKRRRRCRCSSFVQLEQRMEAPAVDGHAS